MKESNIQRNIQIRLSKLGSKLFRVNVGQAWTGRKVFKVNRKNLFKMRASVVPGDIIIKEPRPFKSGVPKGYPDLTGFTPVIITEDMVGKTIAAFTAIEVKSEKGRATKEQTHFIEQVGVFGGLSGFARSEIEAEEIINLEKWLERKS